MLKAASTASAIRPLSPIRVFLAPRVHQGRGGLFLFAACGRLRTALMGCAARGRGLRARLGPRARPEDELHALMSSIIDWAISFLSETNRVSIRAVYYEGKTVREHSIDEVVIVYKRLDRSYPVMREIILEEIEALDPDARADLVALFGIGGRDA